MHCGDLSGGFQKLFNDFLVGDQAVIIGIHQLSDLFREQLRFDDICAFVDGDLFGNKLFQDFDGDVLFLHLGDFFQDTRVEQ